MTAPAKATPGHSLTIEKGGAWMATRFGLERDTRAELKAGMGPRDARQIYKLSNLEQPAIDRMMTEIADHKLEHEVRR